MLWNPSLFDTEQHPNLPLRLILPSRTGAVDNAPWTRDTVWGRSRVETLDGETVSQSFGKFFNLGQGPLDLQVTFEDIAKAAKKGKAVATLKLDGTLLIRSVFQGQVLLRTRGCFDYSKQPNANEVEEFKQAFSKLMDSGVCEDISLLLEWTTPSNCIVLKYPKPELTIVGAVGPADGKSNENPLEYVRVRRLEVISHLMGIPLVPFFFLTVEGWQELHASLGKNHEIEGYVIRLNDEQSLAKVKCPPYLTKHALKSCLTTEKLADMYFQLGRPNYKVFIEQFKAQFDEETCLWALPAISSLYDGVKELHKIEDSIKTKAAERFSWSQKEVAIRGQQEYGQTKKFAFYMNCWSGKREDRSRDLLKSILLQHTKQVELLRPGQRLSKEDDDG